MEARVSQVVVFLIVIAFPGAAPAQYSAQALAGTASNDFIGEYVGLAVSGRYTPIKTLPIGLVAGLSLSFHSTSFRGTICDSYWPTFANCASEKINSDGRTSSFSLGGILAPTFQAWKPALEIGFEWSALSMTATSDSTNRRTGSIFPGDYDFDSGARLLDPNGRYFGVSIARTFGSKLSVSIGYRSRWFDYQTCATDVGTPFCREYASKEGRVGIEFVP